MTGASRKKPAPLMLRIWRFGWRKLGSLTYKIIRAIPYFHFLRAYEDKQGPIDLSIWFFQKFLGFNRGAYWGVHFCSRVTSPKNIIVGANSNPGIEPGCYIQGLGTIEIGDHTRVAANVCIISANHDTHDLNSHVRGRVQIGSFCWIGANSVILPNVNVGDFTIVGAGSVVTKSYPEGYCVIAGNPARKIRDLDPSECVGARLEDECVGYMKKDRFPEYRSKNLWA